MIEHSVFMALEKGNDAKNPAILRLFFFYRKNPQLNAAHA